MKLRLLLFEECNRNCLGCCNKDWNLDSLEKETAYEKYDEILLTGGEPLLKSTFVINTIYKIRKTSNAPIFVYTAKVDNLTDIFSVLDVSDGLTVTLHEQSDVYPFNTFNNALLIKNINGKSLRCNIFKDIKINLSDYPLWVIKNNIEWIKNCPLPENEVFKRIY